MRDEHILIFLVILVQYLGVQNRTCNIAVYVYLAPWPTELQPSHRRHIQLKEAEEKCLDISGGVGGNDVDCSTFSADGGSGAGGSSSSGKVATDNKAATGNRPTSVAQPPRAAYAVKTAVLVMRTYMAGMTSVARSMVACMRGWRRG